VVTASPGVRVVMASRGGHVVTASPGVHVVMASPGVHVVMASPEYHHVASRRASARTPLVPARGPAATRTQRANHGEVWRRLAASVTL